MNHVFVLAYLVIGCVFLYLLLQTFGYLKNYDDAVTYVSGEYSKAYANITCCNCIRGLTIDKFTDNPIFGNLKPNVSINKSGVA
jgi:hypothetical protein